MKKRFNNNTYLTDESEINPNSYSYIMTFVITTLILKEKW